MSSVFNLDKKVAVVTGSTAGIGKAIAESLAQQGCFVILNGRNEATCKAAQASIQDSLANIDFRERIGFVVGDVSTPSGAQDAIAQFESAAMALAGSPFVDILINNVGIFETQSFFAVTDEKWETYFQTNLMSGVRLSRHFLQRMLDADKGRIIFISSECGLRPIPLMIPYSVSKTMQIALARGLAELTKGSRVTVNSVLPGPTMTEGVAEYLKGFAAEKGLAPDVAEANYLKDFEPTSLLQRFLKPAEIANAVLFLVSDMGSGVNGAAQKVEGGIIRSI